MKKRQPRGLDFEVDALTNSLVHVLTGEVLETEVVQLSSVDSRKLRSLDWAFDWNWELEHPHRIVHALLLKRDQSVWQGLMSSEDGDDHLFMHLLESSPSNRGADKQYRGVPANLVAFLCKKSFEMGFGGHVVFEPKTRLISHYEETLRAQLISRSRMLIATRDAHRLVSQYFPKFDDDKS